MSFPVTLNGRTYTLADFEGTNYVQGFPDALEDFVTHAGDTYQTTSTTSVALGTGSKTFTTADSGKPYASGTPLRISSQADETDYIDGLVTSYSGTTLVVNAVGFLVAAPLLPGTLTLAVGQTLFLAPCQSTRVALARQPQRRQLQPWGLALAIHQHLLA